MPTIRKTSVRRRAERAAHDIELVTNAAMTIHARSGGWPEDAVSGHVPRSMAPVLPQGFTFEREAYTLDWDRWQLADDTRPGAGTSMFAGVSVTVRDPGFRALVARAVGERRANLTVGDRVTWSLSDAPPTTR